MKYDWIDNYLLSKQGVTKNFKEEWNWIRYNIEDKMFVAVCLDNDNNPHYITLKLAPQVGIKLREEYEDIIPGYYMNKTHWNSIKVDGNIDDELMKDMLNQAYQIVLASFSKKKQQEILNR